jgi:hypothetical protein
MGRDDEVNTERSPGLAKGQPEDDKEIKKRAG